MNLAYPYHYDARGTTAASDEAAHVRELIEQLLFTVPGERLMRPDFGSGVAQLVFAPNSPELAGATQMLVQAALQQWLGDVITLNGVRVESEDATLSVLVQYTLRRTGETQLQRFEHPGGAAGGGAA